MSKAKGKRLPEPTLPNRSFEDLQAQAIAILRLHPGIELGRFATKMGLPVTARSRKTQAVKLLERSEAVVEALQTNGIIRVEAARPPLVGLRVWGVEQGSVS